MGKALFGLWLAQKGSAETSVPLTESSRSHEDVPGSNLPQHTVVTDSGQSHRSNAATLFAVRISSKLAGRDRRPKVGRDGLCGSGKYALVRVLGWKLHFPKNSLWHLKSGILQPQLPQVGDGRSSLRSRQDLWIGGAALGSENAEPYLCNL